MIEFKIDDEREKEIKEWKDKLIDIHGEYGTISYMFTPTGIGDSIQVFSSLSKKPLDISHEEEW